MALVLLRDENEGRDKHVESTLFPRLDEGSIPSSSTKKVITDVITFFVAMLFYQRATRIFITKPLQKSTKQPYFNHFSAHKAYICAKKLLQLAQIYYFCAVKFTP